MSAQTKIAVHSLADLKNTTDDALPTYLTRPPLQFKQSNSETDVRLVLGYSAVIIAGALFYYDWTQGWDSSKPYTAPAVVIYFILNAAFTYWIWGVEKGTIFVGYAKGGEKIRISSHTKKHTPVYELKVTVTGKSSKTETLEISAPFSNWFSSDGYFIAKPFQQWLASNVTVIGAADPNNIVEEIGRGSGASTGVGTGVEGKASGARSRRKG